MRVSSCLGIVLRKAAKLRSSQTSKHKMRTRKVNSGYDHYNNKTLVFFTVREVDRDSSVTTSIFSNTKTNFDSPGGEQQLGMTSSYSHPGREIGRVLSMMRSQPNDRVRCSSIHTATRFPRVWQRLTPLIRPVTSSRLGITCEDEYAKNPSQR